MTRHYHQIWTTLQVANQQWKQWLQTNSKQPFHPISTNTTSTNNDLAPFATSAENMSLVELEMEIVNELEQSLSEIDSGNGSYQLDSNYNGETVFAHDLGARNSQWTSNSTTTTSSTNSCVDSKEDDYTLLHTDNHRNVCKTIDFILDQDAKSLSKMKQSWQQLQQWSRQCVEKKRKWSNNLFKYSSSRTIREDSYATPNSRREQQDIQGGVHGLSPHTFSGTNTQVYIEETAFYKRFVFPNGNCREIYPDGRIETCYALSQIHKIEFPNGCTLIFFPDGQLERHLPDKRIEVIYADGSLGLVSKDGNKEKVFLGNGKVVYRNRMSNSISERLYETTKERR